jgi:hypothetical protein
MVAKEGGMRLNIEEGEKTKMFKMFPTIPTIRLLQLAIKMSFGLQLSMKIKQCVTN